MQCHFAQADVAGLFPLGFEKFFKYCASEKRDHAIKLCNYHSNRDRTIEKLPKICYMISDAFVSAMQTEKKLTEKLIKVKKKTALNCVYDVTVYFVVSEFFRNLVR